MKSVLASKSSLFSLYHIRLKEKNIHLKKVTKYISKLKISLNKNQDLKRLNFLLEEKLTANNFLRKKKGFIVLYSICFLFSPVNTFLYVTDSLGNLKFQCSAGLLDFKGKAKKSRFQILKMFFKELKKLKISLLKTKPILLALENVGSYRHLIIRNLKKSFFIRIINNFQTHPYNGCRKKKQLRK